MKKSHLLIGPALAVLLTSCGGISEEGQVIRASCIALSVGDTSYCDCQAKIMDKTFTEGELATLAEAGRLAIDGGPDAAERFLFNSRFDESDSKQVARLEDAAEKIETDCRA